jgi:cytoskeletal protein CcmA (bactofilin family)
MADTTIGSRTRIDGQVTGDDPVSIQGEVRGSIVSTGRVTVERGARVEAEVQGGNVLVHGTVHGRVIGADRVEILPGARMIGDVRTPRILISDGAVFKGRVDMDIGE